nr:endochitinase A-like isoform X2 [Pelodiscus sinensis]|eukprot:XP_025044148.1 endochitinase A-like isoform X2 [Pelodiscus sinensis]
MATAREQNARLALYEKYVPDVGSYNLIQSSWNTLSFSLDFPKPPRPGIKARSKPSDLQRNKVTKQDKLESLPFEVTSEPSAFQFSNASKSAPEEPTEDLSEGPISSGSPQEPILGTSPQLSQEPMPGPIMEPSPGPAKSHKGFFRIFSLLKRKKPSPTLVTSAVAVSTSPTKSNETKSPPGIVVSSSATSKESDLIISKKQDKSNFPLAKINSKSSPLLFTPPPESSSKALAPALPEIPTTSPLKSHKAFFKLRLLSRTRKPSPILASKAVSVSTFPSMANETKSPPALIASSSTTQATAKGTSTLVNTSNSPLSVEVIAPHPATCQTVLPKARQATVLLFTPSVKSATDNQANLSISDPSGAAMRSPGETINLNRATSTLTPGASLQKKAVLRSAPLQGSYSLPGFQQK